MGGATGVFAGLLALVFSPAGLIIGGGALIGAMGAGLGGLQTGLAGSAFSNSRLQAFEAEIDAGGVLVMVDVPNEQVERINALIRRLEPEVVVEGVEPPAPIIPT